MRKHTTTGLLLLALAFMQGAQADVRITGTDAAVSLEDIAGTPTLVTVVIRDSGARDANLKVTEVHSDRILFLTAKGDIVPYLKESVEEIVVQGGAVEQRRLPRMDTQIMRAEHQRVVDRGWTRIREIYDDSADDQSMRIRAATLLMLTGDTEASNYLRGLADSNDIMTQLQAAGALYLAGDVVSGTLLRQGLESGNRNARAQAAGIAGLTGYTEGIYLLLPMAKDRAVQLSAPAVRALARLGYRDIVPRAMSMILELNEEKGEAAIDALTRLADEEVINQIRFRLLEAEGMIRFRLVRVLYHVQDPAALEELRHVYANYPTLMPQAALLLAREGDWEATQFLRNRLTRREDPTEPNLRYRAENACALLEGGDPTAMAVFQELLRSDNDAIIRHVFNLMINIGSPRLVTLLQSSIENVNKEIALGACKTVAAIALPDFRQRLIHYRDEFGD